MLKRVAGGGRGGQVKWSEARTFSCSREHLAREDHAVWRGLRGEGCGEG